MTLNVFCHYDDFRTPSLERRQECCVRKQVNGNMTLSEESIILMTPYRLPHHGNRSFTFVQDDAQRFPPHYNSKSFADVSYDT